MCRLEFDMAEIVASRAATLDFLRGALDLCVAELPIATQSPAICHRHKTGDEKKPPAGAGGETL